MPYPLAASAAAARMLLLSRISAGCRRRLRSSCKLALPLGLVLQQQGLPLQPLPGKAALPGGSLVNTDAQVLNTDGSIIPGLYAAGETTGGVHGGNRIGGNAVCDFVVFGRIAGSNASAYAAA